LVPEGEVDAIRPEVVCAADGEEIAEDGVIEIAEGAQTGSRATMKMADPARPSAREVEEHELTHLPF
jgi:hypothetical protein